MWTWIKHWNRRLRDWLMTDLLGSLRNGPLHDLRQGYEKAGLVLYDRPIPWNAEAVVVEARLRLPGGPSRRREAFSLHLSGATFSPDSWQRSDGDFCDRLLFRLPPLARTQQAALFWRDRLLGQFTLPVISQEEFFQELSLHLPTVFVLLGEHSVACQAFVASQCRGLAASALLANPYGLAPLADSNLWVEFRSQRDGRAQRFPLHLSSAQLSEAQALVTIQPRRFPRRTDTWQVRWLVEERVLASQQLRAVSKATFLRSLQVLRSYFVVKTVHDTVLLMREPPPRSGLRGLGPCFLIGCREPGLAGICRLRIQVQLLDGIQLPPPEEQEVLLAEGPYPFTPGFLDASQLDQVLGFELRVCGRRCPEGLKLKNNTLPLSPLPAATITSEGGFKLPPAPLSWSAAAESQLQERLKQLGLS
jgi:hypothetical protein